jgi:phosphoribosylformylglycinamidine cyclo-ligase
LARRVVAERLSGDWGARPAELGGASVGEALLAPHRSYLELLWPLLEERRIQAMAHITGGGFPGNVNRILGGRADAWVDRGAWQPPGLFRLLVERGAVPRDEAYRVFNMGIGMVLVVAPGDADRVCALLRARGETAPVIGEVRAGSGRVHYIS